MSNFDSGPKSPGRHKEEAKQFIHDLFSLDKVEEQNLRRLIVKNEGLVRIMVHPYFVQQDAPVVYTTRGNDPVQRIDIVEKGFERIMKARLAVPVFLFESFEQIDNTKRRILPILKKSGNEIYIEPTFPADSLPFLEYPEDKRGKEWGALIELMKKLGVSRIIIGGVYLDVNKMLPPTGCVGQALRHLEGYFDIQISTLAHPDSRKDIKEPDRKKLV